MSARLAAEIAEHIEEATNANRNGARDTSHFEMRLAGVKATLFAAEQQRLANLIEWLGDGELSTDPAKREAQLAVKREIEEGLGLA